MDQKLFEYFMENTKENFEKTHAQIDKMDKKLDDLAEFKIKTLAVSKNSALWISSACGIFTFCITSYLAWKLAHA